MIKIRIFLSLLIFLAVGCSEKKTENLSPYKTLIFAMQNSSTKFSEESTAVIKKLRELKEDPRTFTPASIWCIKAELIRSKTSEFINYIDRTKTDLKNEAKGSSIHDKGQQIVFQEN